MTDAEVRALIVRANSAGHESLAEYAASLESALRAVEWGYGEGCPDCGATGRENDNHRLCCLVARSLHGEPERAA